MFNETFVHTQYMNHNKHITKAKASVVVLKYSTPTQSYCGEIQVFKTEL